MVSEMISYSFTSPFGHDFGEATCTGVTQHAYDHVAVTTGGLRPGPLAIYVRASKSLEAKAAAAALPKLREAVGRARRGNFQQLQILRGDGARVGWTFANGKLTEGEPHDE